MPVSIPPFTNVPAPGDGVTSAWAQQLTQFAVDSPRGRVGYAQITATQSGITTVVDVAGLSVTFTADPTRRYLFTAQFLMVTAVAADQAELILATGANVQLQMCSRRIENIGNGETLVSNVSVAGISGSYTVKVRAAIVGTGPGTVYSAGGTVGFLLVQDVGKA